jgi:GTP-binding protein
MPLKLAIVGRPNVGKSTLFNRLAGKRLAIVDDRPGVTRDRRTAPGRLGDIDLELIDTAGFEDVSDESLEARMRAQTEQAIEDADLCLFVFDAREGITPLDRIFADLLRRRDKPVIVLANKAEGRQGELGAADAFAIGLGAPIPISAEHGEGISDLYDAVLAAHPGAGEDPEDAEAEGKPVMIAIVGRPNAGKSTLVNRLLGEDRLLTGPEAGITRDAISVDWTWDGRPVRLVDTAGLRKKAKVQEHLEKLSTHDSIRAITFAEVVILVMDAANAFETQDLQLADLVEREGRGLIFCISKWDLVDNPAERLAELKETAERMLPQVRGTPLIALSAETGRGVERLMPAVFGMHRNWSTKVKTRDLNDWLSMAVQRHPPPAVNGKRIKPKYMAQLKGRPPTFVLFASRADHLPESYRRYLINSLRESFDLPGVPIRISIKANKNPYADEGEGNRAVATSADGPSKHEKKKIAGQKRATVAEVTPAPRPEKTAKAKPSTGKSFRVGANKAALAKKAAGKTGPKKADVKAAQGRAAAKRAAVRTPTTHKLRKPPTRKGPPKR